MSHKGIASMTRFINSVIKDHKYVLNFHKNLKKFSLQILYTKLTNGGHYAIVQLECVPQGPVLADLVYLLDGKLAQAICASNSWLWFWR